MFLVRTALAVLEGRTGGPVCLGADWGSGVSPAPETVMKKSRSVLTVSVEEVRNLIRVKLEFSSTVTHM